MNAQVLGGSLPLITLIPITSKSCWIYPQNLLRNVAIPHLFHGCLSDTIHHYLLSVLLGGLLIAPLPPPLCP